MDVRVMGALRVKAVVALTSGLFGLTTTKYQLPAVISDNFALLNVQIISVLDTLEIVLAVTLSTPDFIRRTDTELVLKPLPVIVKVVAVPW
jgi:hypothetical protein